jgi:hypothetical protein
MCAQRLLEGETYVTISMILFIIWKVRKELEDVIESQESSPHVCQKVMKEGNVWLIMAKHV